MSTDLSQIAEGLDKAAEEASQSIVIANAGLSWLPVVCGIALIATAIASIILIWKSTELQRHKKVTKTISTVLWCGLFSGLSFTLSSFAADGNIEGSTALFVCASLSLGAGGISALYSRIRGIISWNEIVGSKNGDDDTKLPPSISSFWGGIDKRAISVGITENVQDVPAEHPNESAIRSKYSRMLADGQRNAPNIASLAFWARVFSFVMSWLLPLLLIAGVSVLCFVFLEAPSNSSFMEIPDTFLIAEISVIAGVVAGSWFIFQRRPIGFVTPMIVSFGYGLAEYFVESFKSAAIMPSDLRSAGTGMAVAGGYDYEITTVMLVLVALFAIAAGGIAWLRDPLARVLERTRYTVSERYQGAFLPKVIERRQKRENVRCLVKNAICAVLSVVLGLYIVSGPIATALDTDWEDEGLVFDYWQTHLSIDGYGIIPSFIAAMQLEELDAPEGYTYEQAEELQTAMAGLYDQFIESSPERIAAAKQFDSIRPNVVLIMNESFADLSFLGGLGVGYEGPEYVDNMNSIARGNTSVSVYGGGTCNSEFEGLTGTSLGLVSGGINPYSVYDLSELNTIPKQFKALGYDTTAIHPEFATNWGRDGVYPRIGFDQFLDKDAFGEDVERVRGHVRDSETYEKVLEVLEGNDEPQFVFDLTMMGHGGYESGLIPEEENTGYDFSVLGFDDGASNVTNEYLSSIRMSDEDVQAFLSALKDFDEPTVVAFYGDHQPSFSWWFQERFSDRTSDTTYQESMYRTDYFVWSNYDVAGSAWNPGYQPGYQTPELVGAWLKEPEPEAQGDVVEENLDDGTWALEDGLLLAGEGNIDDIASMEGIVGGQASEDANVFDAVGNAIEDEMTELSQQDVIVEKYQEERVAAGLFDMDLDDGEDATEASGRAYVKANLDEYPQIEDSFATYQGTMSPASIMAWTMSFIGAPLTDYEKANYISRWWVQSNNLYGYMDGAGWWHSLEEADEIPGDEVFEDGMRIIEQCADGGGLPGAEVLVEGIQSGLAEEEQAQALSLAQAHALGIDEGAVADANSEMSDEGQSDGKGRKRYEFMSDFEKRQYDDAVMVNVMRWISYMNFAELI